MLICNVVGDYEEDNVWEEQDDDYDFDDDDDCENCTADCGRQCLSGVAFKFCETVDWRGHARHRVMHKSVSSSSSLSSPSSG